MATLEDILGSLNGPDYFDDTVQYVIDENLRTIEIPPDGVVLGALGDKDTNRVNFVMVRYYNGFDLSKFRVKVNYQAADEHNNYSRCDDVKVEQNHIMFTWLCAADVYVAVGDVKFSVELTSGSTNVFNTTLATAKVLESIRTDGVINGSPEVESAVDRFLEEIDAAGSAAISGISAARDEAVSNIESTTMNLVKEHTASLSESIAQQSESIIEISEIVGDNKIRDLSWEQGSLYSADGSENDNLKATRIRSNFIEIKDSVCNATMPYTALKVIAFIYDADKNFIRATGSLLNTNFTADGKYIRFVAFIDGNAPIDVSEGNKIAFSYPNIKNVDNRITELENPVKRLKYVAFGDSLTIGRRSDDWVFQTDRAYPAVFGKYFNYDTVNLGVGGQGLTYNATSEQINLAYDHVVAHHDDIVDADLITLKWGNNDRGNGNLDGCINAYKQIFEYVKSVNPYARIVVLSPNNVSTSGTAQDGYWLNGAGKFTLNAFHVAVSNLCKTYGIIYVDVNAWTQIDALSNCLGDNVHPKEEAFEKYHRHVAFCIASVLSTEKGMLIDLGEFTDLTYIDKTSGQQKTGTSVLSSSDFIKVAPKSRILFNNVAVQNNASICEYDVSKRYLRTLVGGSWTTSFVLETGEDARYIRVTAKKLDESRPSAFYINEKEYIDGAFNNTYLSEKSYPLTKVKNKAIFTVIDDDTSTLPLVQRYHDLCTSLGIKGNFAVITSHTKESEALTNKLLEYEEEGFGMLYHCYEQTNVWSWTSAFDLSACEQNYVKGKRLYKQAGFVSGDEFFIAPFGQNRQSIQDMVKRHGCEVLLSTDNNVVVGYDGSTVRYNVPRCSLGHNAERYPHFTIEQLKSKIDEAYANNGWIIITTHVNEWGDTNSGEQRFAEVVNYAKSKGLECKTFAEAYEDRKAMFYAFETM